MMKCVSNFNTQRLRDMRCVRMCFLPRSSQTTQDFGYVYKSMHFLYFVCSLLCIVFRYVKDTEPEGQLARTQIKKYVNAACV